MRLFLLSLAKLTGCGTCRWRVRRIAAGAAAVLTVGSLAFRPMDAVAQYGSGGQDGWHGPRYVGHLTFLGTSALMGGVTAGIAQRVRGGEFSDGFTRGALGGAIAYGGRWMTSRSGSGAGLLGRQTAAVGISVVRNAAEGRPSLERIVLPLGPVNLYLDRAGERLVQPKVFLPSLVQTAVLVADPDAAFDGSATLSAATPVFRSASAGHAQARAGVILLRDAAPSGVTGARIFAHERVHVLQHDFGVLVWWEPVDAWLADRTRPTRWLDRHFDFGASWGLFHLAQLAMNIGYTDRLSEVEAYFLDGSRPGGQVVRFNGRLGGAHAVGTGH